MKSPKPVLVIIFILAFIFRISVTLVGYHGDLNNNISWGIVAYENGLNGLYEGIELPLRDNGEVAWPYSAPNQPPLTILMFAGLRLIWQNVRDFLWYMNWELLVFPSKLVWFWDDHGMTILVKLPSIIADLGIGYLIYNYFKSKDTLNIKLRLKLSLLWLFNPIAWYNSSIWGQTDSVVNLLGLIGVFALLQKKLIKFALFFTLSFLFKGSLSIFIPVLAFVAFKQKHRLKTWLIATTCSLLTITLLSVWFHPQPDLFIWLIKLYQERILPGEIGYLTANAFNFWWLINPGKIYDSTIVFGLTYRIWSLIAVLLTLSGIIFWLSKKLTDKRILISLCLTALFSFLFLTRIHERYLYPFFPLATILLGFVPALTTVYILYSLIHLVNLYNLFWVPGIPVLENMLKTPSFAFWLSLINLLLFVLTLRLLQVKKDIL